MCQLRLGLLGRRTGEGPLFFKSRSAIATIVTIKTIRIGIMNTTRLSIDCLDRTSNVMGLLMGAMPSE